MAEKMYQGRAFENCPKGSLKGAVAVVIITGLFCLELAYFLARFVSE